MAHWLALVAVLSSVFRHNSPISEAAPPPKIFVYFCQQALGLATHINTKYMIVCRRPKCSQHTHVTDIHHLKPHDLQPPS